MWKGIIDIALIGTEKKTLALENLPKPIAELMQSKMDGNREQIFLDALSYLSFYQDHGKQSIPFSGEVNRDVITEDKAIASKELLVIFNKIKELDHFQKEPFLKDWMHLLLQEDKIVRPDLIIPILEFGNSLSKSAKKLILQIIGKKGRAVLPISKHLKYVELDFTNPQWEDGSNADRLKIFKVYRTENPSQALELLQANWEQEAIRTKKSYLSIIDDQLEETDLFFLESLYQQEFAYTDKEKKTHKECRMLLAAMLLRIPTSSLYQETTDILKNYLNASKKKSLLGKLLNKESELIQLPENGDHFFNAKNMVEKYGLEDSNVDPGVYQSDTHYWFAFFLITLPMDFWAKQSGQEIRSLANLFLNGDAFQLKMRKVEVPMFKSALMDHCKYYKEASIIKVLFASYPFKEVVHLLEHLDMESYENLVRNRNLQTNVEALSYSPLGKWSNAFAAEVIEKHYDQIANQRTWIQEKVGRRISIHLDHEILPTLLKFNDFAKKTQYYNNWQKQFFEPLHLGLEIRNMIKQYKSKI